MNNQNKQNNNDFEKTIPEFKNLKLDETAKINMRARLMDHAASNSSIISSPYISSVSKDFEKNYFKNILINYNKYAAVCVFVLAFGTAFAAQASLPGDKLYSLKTKVIEPAIKLTKLSKDAEVSYSAELAIKRQDELKEVLTQNRTDENTKLDVLVNQESFNENVTALQDYKKERPDSIFVDTLIDLPRSISGYQNILLSIDANCKCDAPTLAATTTDATSTPIKVLTKINNKANNGNTFKAANAAIEIKLNSTTSTNTANTMNAAASSTVQIHNDEKNIIESKKNSSDDNNTNNDNPISKITKKIGL